MTDIDIRETANRVQALFAQNRTREAVQLLEQERRDEPRAVQEALDRYVAKGAETQLTALQRTGALNAEDTALLSPSLQRLQAATAMPRFPAENETETTVERNLRHGNSPRTAVEPATLTDAQQYDVYASIVMTRGNDEARRQLGNGQQRVILGLRQENSTLDSMTADNPRTTMNESQTGKGVYDDRLVVLWKDANGMGHVVKANKANTEPTAQYDHNAGSDGRRQLGEIGIETRVINPSPGFENVTVRRKIEGEDVNNDRMRDMGRLGQGTVEMIAATHTNPAAAGTQFALRPSPEAVTAGRGQVQRDTNGDGWFTQADINGVQDLNNTFKIHSGSRNNTDSAGCQTIHPDRYAAFMDAVRGAPNNQDRWQYVLTATTPGMFRNINLEQAPNIDRQQGQQVPIPNGPERADQQGRPDAPRNGPPGQDPQRPNQLDPQERPGQAPPVPRRGAGGQAALGSDDLNPQDKEQHEKIRIAVQKLGFDGEPAANISAALLLATKEHGGIRRIDDITLNEPGKINAEGTLAIAAYRPHGVDKPPFFNARVELAEASQMPAEKTFKNIENFNQQQSQQQVLAQQKAQEKQQNPDNQGYSPQLPGGPAKPGGPSMA
jgi:hypothetical protein